VAAAAFVACAAVQLNDPDPMRWVALYGAAAVTAVAVSLGRPLGAVTVGVAVVAALWGVALLPSFIADGAAVTEEVGREIGGLVLVSGWSTGSWAWWRRRRLRAGPDRAKEGD
jgi:hypothetical protein